MKNKNSREGWSGSSRTLLLLVYNPEIRYRLNQMQCVCVPQCGWCEQRLTCDTELLSMCDIEKKKGVQSIEIYIVYIFFFCNYLVTNCFCLRHLELQSVIFTGCDNMENWSFTAPPTMKMLVAEVISHYLATSSTCSGEHRVGVVTKMFLRES